MCVVLNYTRMEGKQTRKLFFSDKPRKFSKRFMNWDAEISFSNSLFIKLTTNHYMYTTSRACVWIPNEKQCTTLQ